MKRKLLVFHPIVAPYRIDFFNRLCEKFDTQVCLLQRNLKSQKFDYKRIEEQFDFVPIYLDEKFLKIFPIGVISRIKSFDPDFVLVPECGIVSILVLLCCWVFRKKYRIISIIDDSYDMITGNNQFSKKHEIAEKLLIPHFDNIITVEPKVARYFQEKYGKGIYFPIIVDENKARERYKNLLPISESLVRQYNLEGKKVLLFVGRLVELKNLQMVIPTFKKIIGDDLRFVIVGDGSYATHLRNLAKDDNRIIFLGRKEGDELYAWYNVAQCFVLASYQEPFGAVTNEALIGGCWALISDKAGSKCLVQPGLNGDVFNPFDNAEFEHKMLGFFIDSTPISLPLELRDNKMLIEFDEKFSKLLEAM